MCKIEEDIKAKARRYRIPGMGIEDVEQELRILCWQKEKNIDKEKGDGRAYLNTCMRNWLTNKYRYNTQQKRDYTLESELTGDVPDPTANGMANYFSEEFYEKYL